ASGIRSIDDTRRRETTLGTSSGANSTGVTVPRILNTLVGPKFKVIPGYPGSLETILSMQRGEVDGRYSPGWAGPEANTVNDLVAAGKARLIAYLSPEDAPQLSHLPNIMQFARDSDSREILRVVLSAQGL